LEQKSGFTHNGLIEKSTAYLFNFVNSIIDLGVLTLTSDSVLFSLISKFSLCLISKFYRLFLVLAIFRLLHFVRFAFSSEKIIKKSLALKRSAIWIKINRLIFRYYMFLLKTLSAHRCISFKDSLMRCLR
jgi:hypothetical protein